MSRRTIAPPANARGDLPLAVLRADLRAQAPVDGVERGRVAGAERLAPGDARDLLERLRVGRDGRAARCRAASGR